MDSYRRANVLRALGSHPPKQMVAMARTVSARPAMRMLSMTTSRMRPSHGVNSYSSPSLISSLFSSNASPEQRQQSALTNWAQDAGEACSQHMQLLRSRP